MPCHPEYPSVTALDKEIGKVYYLLDELDGIPLNKTWWSSGMHRNVTDKALDEHDLRKVAAELCRRLQKIEDVSSYSTELQQWWDEHKKADRLRLESEMEFAADREKFLQFLNDYERSLLNA
ncbi:MAG: hypothetical protein AAGJ82_07105 [Bacteroidota bacterium]